MTLCLGPTGSGKTLLLKNLQDDKAIDETTTSVPTVGINIFKIKCENDKVVTVKEVGGAMAPLWSQYLQGVRRLIYVVDASDLCQISAAGVLLYSLLVHPDLSKARILLVLTKMDVSYRQMRNEALLMLQIERLKSEIEQDVTIVETSVITDEGTKEILEWLGKK